MTQKVIEGDLILKEDTTFSESILVKGNIKGFFNLKVAGNINARDINAWDINARDINAWNIDAWDINARDIDAWDIDAGNINARNINAKDINAWDINARNINAWNIVCEKRIKKSESNKTFCRIFVKNKSRMERKEHDTD